MVAQFFTVLMALTSASMSVPVEVSNWELALHPVEQELIEATNEQRVRYGLSPLRPDPQLILSARRHARWMTVRRSLQHTTAPVAENIAMGQRNTREAIRSWMNSPGHRANILGRGYRSLGVAAYVTPEGTIYWCQQFN